MASGLIYILIALGLVSLCIKPLGCHMALVYMGKRTFLDASLGRLERLIYAICGIDPAQEMDWRGYAAAILALGLMGFCALFGLFSLQGLLPLNPQGLPGLPGDAAFNAAVSFVTNTNWQSYSGETTLSYLSQMAGCAVQNFLSAATGMAVAVALFRGLARKQTSGLGNAYSDVVRGVLYILLPLSLVMALALASQGVVQNFSAYIPYSPVDSAPEAPLIAQGPAASQVAIKMLGSNGGGFFGANAAHPYENPTPLSNLLQIVTILLIPVCFAYTFGVMVGDRRQGWMLLAAMSVFLPLMTLGIYHEQRANPRFDSRVINSEKGNLEGKELRFGVASTVMWAAATTATSNGSVNSSHDSYQPLGGLMPLLLMQFGEVVFGGVGSGVYGMLMFVMLTVFMGGLMVGRTPEYLGKKLGPFEIKMASLVIIIPAALVLTGTAVSLMCEAGRSGILNPGAQGFSEVLYAFTSAAGNNGSAFAGLSAGTPYYNIFLGVVMFIGRYWLIVPVLAIAGSLAHKNQAPQSAGTLPTHTPLFTGMLVGIIALIGVLTYVPAMALGPIAEHLHLTRGDRR